MIAAVFPEAPAFWIGVFRCESVGFKDDVVNGPHVSATNDRGIAQVNAIHAGKYAARGWDYYGTPRDVGHDLAIAREIADQQGSRAWTCAR